MEDYSIKTANSQPKHVGLTEEQITIVLKAYSIAPHIKVDGLDGDGWVRNKDFGNKILEVGFDRKSLGYVTLMSFIYGGCNEFLEVGKVMNAYGKPDNYVRPKESARRIESAPAVKDESKSVASTSPRDAFVSWGYIKNYPEVLAELASTALPEDWARSNNGYPALLDNYLRYTFYRLKKEKKVLVADTPKGKVAAFNTGLVNKTYDDIYAYFTKPDQDNTRFFFSAFCTEGVDTGKQLTKYFKTLPKRAQYFEIGVSDYLYNIDMGVPAIDHDHILIEHAERLPKEFFELYYPEIELKDKKYMTSNEIKAYSDELREQMQSKMKKYRQMKSALEEAVVIAFKRVQWNFKSAIPMYYPRTNSISLLFPLCLVSDDKVDVALIVSKQQSGRYLGETVYPLWWAYRNARLVCRPDSDWLKPSSIDSEVEDTPEDE